MRAIAFALCTTGLLAACDAPPETPFIPPTQVIAVDTPPPEYPLEVACEGVGGKVQLFVTIGTEGTVTGAQMRQTSGQPLLDAAALEAVRDWRFRPATTCCGSFRRWSRRRTKRARGLRGWNGRSNGSAR